MHESQLIGKLIDFIYKTENMWRNNPIKNTRAEDWLSHISVNKESVKLKPYIAEGPSRWNPHSRDEEAYLGKQSRLYRIFSL